MAHAERIGELAARTGLTVRALHHYDRIGLLRPSGYSEGGHRLYAETDLLRLQQILTLRALGFPLRRIGEILDRPDFDLVASLRIQRGVVRERIAHLQQIEATLAELVDSRLATGRWDWDLVVAAANVTATTQRGAILDTYYTPEQMATFAAVAERVGPEEIAAVEAAWPPLVAEVRTARAAGIAPTDPTARDLADRWNALLERTLAGFRTEPGLVEAIGDHIEQGHFAASDGAPAPLDLAFIAAINAAMPDGES